MSESKQHGPAATKLRELLAEKDKIVVCPGVYDGFTARIALETGFDCLYMVETTLNLNGNQLTFRNRRELERQCLCSVRQTWE
jgi:hypothetical protein